MLTELYTSSVEVKRSLKFTLEHLQSDDRIRIQAYHFDDDELVNAFGNSSVLRMEILVDERSFKEVERTRATVRRFKDKGADIRLIKGEDMSPLYGNRTGLPSLQGSVHIGRVLLRAVAGIL